MVYIKQAAVGNLFTRERGVPIKFLPYGFPSQFYAVYPVCSPCPDATYRQGKEKYMETIP